MHKYKMDLVTWPPSETLALGELVPCLHQAGLLFHRYEYLIHSTISTKFIFHIPVLPGLRHGAISLIVAKVSVHCLLLLQCLLHLNLLLLDVFSSSLFPRPNEFI